MPSLHHLDQPSGLTSSTRRLLRAALPLAIGGLLLATTGFAQGLPGKGGYRGDQVKQVPRSTGKAGSSASTQQAQELQVPLGGTARLVLKDRNARSLTDVRVLDARGGKTSPSRYLTAVLGRTQRDGSRTLMIQASTRATPGADYVLQGVMGKTTITLDVKVEVLAAGVKPTERSATRPAEKSEPAPKGRPSGPVLKGGLPESTTKGRFPGTATKGSLPGSTTGDRTSKPAPGGRLPGSAPRGGGPTAGSKGSQPGRAAILLGRGSSTRLELKGGDFARILKLRVLRDGKVDRSASVTLERPGREVILNLQLRPDAPLDGERRIEAMIDREWRALPIDLTVAADREVVGRAGARLDTTLIHGGGRVSVVKRGVHEEVLTVPPAGMEIEHYSAPSRGEPVAVQIASQQFYARGEHLERLQIPMGGGSRVLILVKPRDDNSEILFRKTITAPEALEVVDIELETPVSLEPGQCYKLIIQTYDDSEYVVLQPSITDLHSFELTFLRSGEDNGGWSQTDLCMTISGKRLTSMPARPDGRALLIILENGGLSSSIDAINGIQLQLPRVPYLVYPREGDPILELRMNMNENIPQAIQRLRDDILAYIDSAADTPVEHASLGITMLQPQNWRIEFEDFSEVFNTLTDAILEDTVGIVQFMAGTTDKYDRVVVMEDSEARAEPVREMLLELCQDHVLDVHVLTHGRTNAIVGPMEGEVEHTLTRNNFFEPLYRAKAAGMQPLFLRIVYQMNCVSGSLKDEWRALGAEAVNGTRNLESNYLPQQYVHFIEFFMNQGYSFREATSSSYEKTLNQVSWIPMLPQVNAAEAVRMFEDSLLTVVGNGSLTLY